MKLIIGLGNPGNKFAKTRHNFGFMAIDLFRSKITIFPDWQIDSAANALLSKGEFSGEQIILAKPQTFMNLSGQTAQKLANFYKIEPQDVWVIHDDIDLPLGVLRVSRNASNGGHKGIKSIIEMLGTKDFIRFRLGIHQIGQTFLSAIFKREISTEKFVLKNFSKGEIRIVDELISKTALAIETALKEGIAQAMNQFN